VICRCQIEGAYLEDGKSLCNWDVFTHTQGESLISPLKPSTRLLVLPCFSC
jgi:beta-glucosidase/6-phospho-beta-glucosidase/beta-galactosidase